MVRFLYIVLVGMIPTNTYFSTILTPSVMRSTLIFHVHPYGEEDSEHGYVRSEYTVFTETGWEDSPFHNWQDQTIEELTANLRKLDIPGQIDDRESDLVTLVEVEIETLDESEHEAVNFHALDSVGHFIIGRHLFGRYSTTHVLGGQYDCDLTDYKPSNPEWHGSLTQTECDAIDSVHARYSK